MKTLSSLDLSQNEIGEKGAQHLAQVLQNNTVRKVFLSCTTYLSLCFDVDTPCS
jgi:Ran GTPase-activating protein (RanGAP) involved in mRNA processing and transport